MYFFPFSMNTSNTLPLFLLVIAGLMLGLSLLSRFFVSQREVPVISICPHCQKKVGLEKVRNHICNYCKHRVIFFDKIEGGNPIKGTTFTCPDCGELNFKGIMYCTKCKRLQIDQAVAQ